MLHDAVEEMEPDQFLRSLLTEWGVESPVAFDIADALGGSDPRVDSWEVSAGRVVVEVGVESTWLGAPVPPFLSTAPVDADVSLVVSTGLLNRLLAPAFDRDLADVIDAVDRGAARSYRGQIDELEEYLALTVVEPHPSIRLTPSIRWSGDRMFLHIGDLRLLRSRDAPDAEIIVSLDVPTSATLEGDQIRLDLDVADAARLMAAELIGGASMDDRQRATLTALSLRLTRDFDQAASGDALSLANAGPLVDALRSVPPIPAAVETDGVAWRLVALETRPATQAWAFGASFVTE